jgi:hypothetical protein
LELVILVAVAVVFAVQGLLLSVSGLVAAPHAIEELPGWMIGAEYLLWARMASLPFES